MPKYLTNHLKLFNIIYRNLLNKFKNFSKFKNNIKMLFNHYHKKYLGNPNVHPYPLYFKDFHYTHHLDLQYKHLNLTWYILDKN